MEMAWIHALACRHVFSPQVKIFVLLFAFINHRIRGGQKHQYVWLTLCLDQLYMLNAQTDHRTWWIDPRYFSNTFPRVQCTTFPRSLLLTTRPIYCPDHTKKPQKVIMRTASQNQQKMLWGREIVSFHYFAAEICSESESESDGCSQMLEIETNSHLGLPLNPNRLFKFERQIISKNNLKFSQA